LGNIGAGNATTALSQLLGDRLVRMTAPAVAILDIPEVGAWVGEPHLPVVAAYVQVTGGIEGHAVLLLAEASAQAILQEMLGAWGGDRPGLLASGAIPLGERTVSDLEASALMELGNVVITSYLNALGELTGLVAIPSVPSVAADMLEAVLNSILAEVGWSDAGVLAIRTHLQGEGAAVEGQLLFVPAEGHLSRLIQAMGMVGEARS